MTKKVTEMLVQGNEGSLWGATGRDF